MYKRGAIIAILICSMSMTGCIVINTGKDDSDKQTETKKEVIIQRDNSSSSDNNSNDSTKETSRAHEVSGYIFYDSDTRYLTDEDLRGLSSWELKIARNEIYARRGRLFNDSSLQNYFDSCSWYNGYISPNSFNENSLNKIEQYNVKLIKKYE